MPTDAKQAAQKFIDALHQLEEGGDPGAIAECFSDDAKLMSLVAHRTHEGRDGAKEFWQEYLRPFAEIHSDFGRIKADTNHAVLEWTGKGKLDGPNGPRDITYEGVSLLEFEDGSDKIRRFRTYYDSAAFLQPEGQAK